MLSERSSQQLAFSIQLSPGRCELCASCSRLSTFGIRLLSFSFMRPESLQFLETLVNTPSPSGNELRGQRVWMDYAKQFADETWSDAYGNCVAVLNKGGSPRIMLAGHADEIAMTVNFITKEGFIYVRKVGGIDPAIMRGQRVNIHTREGDVRG